MCSVFIEGYHIAFITGMSSPKVRRHRISPSAWPALPVVFTISHHIDTIARQCITIHFQKQHQNTVTNVVNGRSVVSVSLNSRHWSSSSLATAHQYALKLVYACPSPRNTPATLLRHTGHYATIVIFNTRHRLASRSHHQRPISIGNNFLSFHRSHRHTITRIVITEGME